MRDGKCNCFIAESSGRRCPGGRPRKLIHPPHRTNLSNWIILLDPNTRHPKNKTI